MGNCYREPRDARPPPSPDDDDPPPELDPPELPDDPPDERDPPPEDELDPLLPEDDDDERPPEYEPDELELDDEPEPDEPDLLDDVAADELPVYESEPVDFAGDELLTRDSDERAELLSPEFDERAGGVTRVPSDDFVDETSDERRGVLSGLAAASFDAGVDSRSEPLTSLSGQLFGAVTFVVFDSGVDTSDEGFDAGLALLTRTPSALSVTICTPPGSLETLTAVALGFVVLTFVVETLPAREGPPPVVLDPRGARSSPPSMRPLRRLPSRSLSSLLFEP